MSSGAVDHSIFSGIQTALFQSRLQTRVDGRVWFLFFSFFIIFFKNRSTNLASPREMPRASRLPLSTLIELESSVFWRGRFRLSSGISLRGWPRGTRSHVTRISPSLASRRGHVLFARYGDRVSKGEKVTRRTVCVPRPREGAVSCGRGASSHPGDPWVKISSPSGRSCSPSRLEGGISRFQKDGGSRDSFPPE